MYISKPTFRRSQKRALSLLITWLVLVPLLAGCQDSGPERDKWQRPAGVMGALQIKPGSRVADVGSGSGYFTFHLADRVGPGGKVYAVDIKPEEVKKLRKRASQEHLDQIETIIGAEDDPHLPSGTLDAVLVVNAYHEMRQYDAMMKAFSNALRPGGLLGIIDGEASPGKTRKSYEDEHHIPAELVREDAARSGFKFVGEKPGFLRPNWKKKFYFLIFEKPVESQKSKVESE